MFEGREREFLLRFLSNNHKVDDNQGGFDEMKDEISLLVLSRSNRPVTVYIGIGYMRILYEYHLNCHRPLIWCSPTDNYLYDDHDN